MTHSLLPWKRAGFIPAALIFLVLAGCSSDPGPRRGGQAGPRAKPPTPMAGHETFFAGQILAEINVGTEGMPQVQPGSGAGGDRNGAPRGRRGGGGRLGVQGGPGGVAGNISGSMPLGEGGRPAREYGGAPRPMMSSGRPVLIHLRFTNQGTAPVELRISDFVSPLGNFAVRPEKLTLEPSQALETDPMTSQLAGSFSETVATLVLRVNGQTEKKTFPLKAVAVHDKNQDNQP